LLALVNFDYRVYLVVVDSATGKHSVAGHFDVPDPSVTGDFYLGVGSRPDRGGACLYCHTGGMDRQKEGYTLDKHLKEYYPRATLTLSEGQRFSWGPSGGYLTSLRGRLEYYLKDGTLDMITPPGSLILKDRSGQPFMIHMTQRPQLQPRSR
jgi:hypothetical protein